MCIRDSDKIDRVLIEWPSGRTEEHKDLSVGRAYECVEAQGITAASGHAAIDQSVVRVICVRK